jgi:hypothetical protein
MFKAALDLKPDEMRNFQKFVVATDVKAKQDEEGVLWQV